jgi:uncharacterized SAM-binding protein YcdF (DUF218 family)
MSAPSNLGVKFAATYLVLCLLAGAYVLWSPGAMELSGVLLVILALPWSLIGTAAIVSGGGSSAWLFAAAVGLGFLVNAWLLYRLGRARGRVSSHGNA